MTAALEGGEWSAARPGRSVLYTDVNSSYATGLGAPYVQE